jgi:TusA-related sulfurtransferase
VCPLPVARTKKKLSEMESGDILEVTGDFGESGENVKRYVEKHGDSVLEFKINGEDYYIKIKKLTCLFLLSFLFELERKQTCNSEDHIA